MPNVAQGTWTGYAVMKLRIRQSMLSVVVFCIVLGGLVSVDDRVRDRVSDLMSNGDNLTPWGDRVVARVRHRRRRALRVHGSHLVARMGAVGQRSKIEIDLRPHVASPARRVTLQSSGRDLS